MSRKTKKSKATKWRWFDALSDKESVQVLRYDVGFSGHDHDEVKWRKTGKKWEWQVPDGERKPVKTKKPFKPLRKGDRRFVVQMHLDGPDAGGVNLNVDILNVKVLRPAKEKDYAKLPSLCNNLHEDLSPWVVEYMPDEKQSIDYDPDDDEDFDPKKKSKPKPVKAVVNEEDLLKREDHALVWAGRSCLDLSRQLTLLASRCYSKASNMRD